MVVVVLNIKVYDFVKKKNTECKWNEQNEKKQNAFISIQLQYISIYLYMNINTLFYFILLLMKKMNKK